MLKKLISFVTSIALLMGCICTTAGAVDTSDIDVPPGIDPVTWKAIYEQLEAQDALDMLDTFAYIYETSDPLIVPHGSDDEEINAYAPYGGTIAYTTKEYGRVVDVLTMYMDRDFTLHFVLEDLTNINVTKALFKLVGYLPGVGVLGSMVGDIIAVADYGVYDSINNARGYSRTDVVAYQSGEKRTTVSGWTRAPYIYLWDLHAHNIFIEVAPQKVDPWG